MYTAKGKVRDRKIHLIQDLRFDISSKTAKMNL